MFIFIKKALKISLLILFPFNILAQNVDESITYNDEKGTYSIRYWSETNNTYYEVTFFPGDKIIPELNVETIYDNNEDLFQYSYSLSNSKESKRELYTFFIPLNSTFSDIKVPNSTWTGKYIKRFEGIRWVNTKSRSDTLGILPGRSVNGNFSFFSKSLPGIVESKISSYVNLGNVPDEGPSGKMRVRVDSLIDATKAYYVQTVGPVLIPQDATSENLLKTLKKYLYRSCQELNWITNEGICNSLEVKLNNVQKHLDDDKPKQAANVLHAFIHEVNAQKDKALSSEAYALLFYNGQYLMQRLEEELNE